MEIAQLDDIKQDIAATELQATAGLASKDDLAMLAMKQGFQASKPELITSIADQDTKADTSANALSEHRTDREQRSIKLEQKVA